MLDRKKDFPVYMEYLLVFWLDFVVGFVVGVEEGEIDGFLVENVGEIEGVPGV